MLKDKALKNVQAFLSSCDELINGRFIFAENIIAKILQDISESDEIYSLIADCMKNFNFDKEFNRARVKLPTKDGYFIMPESRAIVLPLVFCILVDIRDKKINFNEFLRNYFMSEEINEFENFAQTIIVPFKQAVAYCFDITDEVKVDEQPEETNQTKEDQIMIEEIVRKEPELTPSEKIIDRDTKMFFDAIEIISRQMIDELKNDKKVKQDLRDDVEYLINNMIDCCNVYDLRNVSAYIVAVSYITKSIKSLKFLSQELKYKLTELYSK